MNKSVLITGANGFIGSHLVESAIDHGYEVIAFVRENSDVSYIEKYDVAIHRVDYHQVQNLEDHLAKMDKLDLIIHCAGVTEARDKDGFYSGNVGVTRNLIDALLQADQMSGKFVYFSSLAARGPNDLFVRNGEDSPISTYGQSKREAEQVVQDLVGYYLIVRPTAVYGPRDKAFLALVKAIKRGLEVTLGSKNRKLTMIHGRDLADMIFEAATRGMTLLYGFDGHVYTQNSISEAVRNALGRKGTFKLNIPTWLFMILTKVMSLWMKIMFNRNWTYTPEKAKELSARDWSISDDEDKSRFGPFRSLGSGFEDTVRWYRENNWI